MADTGPKSAFELAMERLRKKDEEAGIAARPLTDEQKAAIAEVRNFYEAKMAEQEVLHRSTLAKTAERSEQRKLEEDYQHDRERLVAERDAKIARIRAGEA